MSEIETGYYLRLRVEDKPGVLADITRIPPTSRSRSTLLQREPEEGEGETDIIVLTHVCKESVADAAIAKIEALPAQGEGRRILPGRAAAMQRPIRCRRFRWRWPSAGGWRLANRCPRC